MTCIPQHLIDAIGELYADLERELNVLNPACEASGRCCDFPNFDHTLFCTTVEAERLFHLHPFEQAQGQRGGELCPYWVERRCTAREGRPLGCRVFYCDEAYQEAHSQRIYESYHQRLSKLIADAGLEYAYVPMVSAINRKVAEDRWFDPAKPYDSYPSCES